MENNGGILVYIELDRDLNIVPVSLELVSKSVELSSKLECKKVMALVIGDVQDNKEIIQSIKTAGADSIIFVQHEKLKEYATQPYSKIACRTIEEYKPEIVLIGATVQGRDLAPRISTCLNTGLTADCTELDINENGKLAATRPTFGGQLMATILCKNLPQMATVRPNTFRINYFEGKESTIDYLPIDETILTTSIEVVNFAKKLKYDLNNLENASVVIGCGRGIINNNGIDLVKQLAKELNASIGATRAAVEAGAFPASYQVGQTGLTIAPKLYIACGISGAVQHLIGVQKADKIIAINKDEYAPIFQAADYGIVADFFDVVQDLIWKISEFNKGNYDA